MKDGQLVENEIWGTKKEGENLLWIDDILTDLKETTRIVIIKGQEINGVKRQFLYILGRFPKPWEKYVLVCQQDIEDIISKWQDIKNMLFLIGAIFSFLLAICLLFLLNRLFRPLWQISSATKNIADGDFHDRLPVFGQDELAVLAESFNQMAITIEEQIGALKRAAEQKQRMVDSLAHELRTPLTAIYGYAEYMQKVAITEEDKIAATEYIMSESRRLSKLSHELLELATLREDSICWGSVRIFELLQAVEHTSKLKAEKYGVFIKYRSDLKELRGDRDLMESLLLNLIDNSMKACESGGKIFVSAYWKENIPAFSVIDNGRGMSQEEILHVKEAFYRVDKDRSRRHGGAGLGLSICEQIIKLHHAIMEISSEYGKGTKIEVLFPEQKYFTTS